MYKIDKSYKTIVYKLTKKTNDIVKKQKIKIFFKYKHFIQDW